MISGASHFLRPVSTPQSDLRGGTAARVGNGAPFQGSSNDPAARPGNAQVGGSGPEARGATGAETPRPVQPSSAQPPQGLLALGPGDIEALQGIKPTAPAKTQDQDAAAKTDQGAEQKGEKQAAPGALSEEEAAQVKDLKARDQEVRRHEQAHAAAGGAIAGAPSYQYQQGPDGQRYAVSGEVSIDISPVAGDPNATIQKMRQVKAAANAPAQPSGQDRSVAASADAISRQAQVELAAEAAEAIKSPEGEVKPVEFPTAPSDRPASDKPASDRPASDRSASDQAPVTQDAKPEAARAPETGRSGADQRSAEAGQVAESVVNAEILSQGRPEGAVGPTAPSSSHEAAQFDPQSGPQPDRRSDPEFVPGQPPEVSSPTRPQRDIAPGSFADISV